MLYKIEIEQDFRPNSIILKVDFGDPAENNDIVKEVSESDVFEGLGGTLVKVTGRVSLPIAFVLSHKLTHLFGSVAVFDPKLQKFVVCVSHTPHFFEGQLID